jgi:hypothetical protein
LSPQLPHYAARSSRKAATFTILLALSKGASSTVTRSSRKTKVVYPNVEELSSREIAQLCLDQDTSHLNDRERQFLDDMSRRYGAPTPKQEAWLFAIHDKLLGRRKKS